jgi:heme exporter protein C
MRSLILGFSLCLILLSGHMAFTIAAAEPAVRNIVYVHVPAAVSAIICLCVLFICSVGFLRSNKMGFDNAAAASAEVALVFATVLNVTGSIFAYAEWGTWWTPSPRLIASAAMWFLCVGYFLLRAAIAGPQRRARICAVFGIIAFIDVPLVIVSARLMRDIHQPQISFDTSWQKAAFGLGIIGTACLALVLVWIRSSMLTIRARLDGEN